MRVVYVTCALLAIVIGSYANTDTVTTKQNDKSVGEQTSVPTLHLNGTNTDESDNKNATTTAVPPTITNATTVVPTTPPSPNSTTDRPTKPTMPTAPTTKLPPSPTTTVKPETTTAAPSPTTTNATTVSPASSTTAIPSTMAPPPTPMPEPSNERHFDGLSFLGGIILATCLMAVAAFSWKLYKTCNEPNYRTL